MDIYHTKYTYVYKYDPWMGVLDAASFTIISTVDRLKCYTIGKLTFSVI